MLQICKIGLGENIPGGLRRRIDAAVEAGIGWLGHHFADNKNPFKKKLQELRSAAAGTCDGCGEELPKMASENTVRRWCSKPRKTTCRKLYRAKTRLRTAEQSV